MGRKLQPLLLSIRQYNLLSNFITKRSVDRQYIERVSIVVFSYEGQSQTAIAQNLGLDYETVRLWRSRWLSSYCVLLDYEKGIGGAGIKDYQLLDKILSLLSDKPRSGAPRVITVAQEQLLTALACEPPCDYGVIRTNWSHETLAQIALEKGIFEQISARYVGKLLKKK
jgi:transposase